MAGRKIWPGRAWPSLSLVSPVFQNLTHADCRAYTSRMDNQPSGNLFREVHEKIQLAKDNLRKAKEARTEGRSKEAAEEAVREGFDRASVPTAVDPAA
jgi:hypothetical protein